MWAKCSYDIMCFIAYSLGGRLGRTSGIILGLGGWMFFRGIAQAARDIFRVNTSISGVCRYLHPCRPSSLTFRRLSALPMMDRRGVWKHYLGYLRIGPGALCLMFSETGRWKPVVHHWSQNRGRGREGGWNLDRFSESQVYNRIYDQRYFAGIKKCRVQTYRFTLFVELLFHPLWLMLSYF